MPTIITRFFLCLVLLIWSLPLEAQWTTLTPMPGTRWAHVCAPANGNMYVLAGSTAPTWEYNPVTNSWAVRASIPTTRSYPAVASWNGMIYVLGGSVGAAWSNLNERFDPATNTWTTLAPMPTVRTTTAAAAVNGKIYVMNGWNGAAMSAVDVYDIATNSWSSAAPAPSARSHAKTGVANNRIYLVGGYAGGWVGTNEVYDPASNTWSTQAAMPTARYIHAIGGAGNQILAAGGYAGSATNSFQSYDVSTNSWTTLANMPTARYRTDGAVVNGCFYVLGGYNGSNLNVNEAFCGLALPLRVNLQAREQGATVLLSWEFRAPGASGEFVVERTDATGVFERISSLRMGDRAESYLFTDTDPMGGARKYRLRMEDADGLVSYSNIVSIHLQPEGELSASYLPATREITLNWQGQSLGQMVQVELISLSGRQLAQHRFDPSTFPEGKTHFRPGQIPPGIYLLRLNSSAVRKVMRIVVWE